MEARYAERGDVRRGERGPRVARHRPGVEAGRGLFESGSRDEELESLSLQRAAQHAAGVAAATRSPARALDRGVRAEMESSFGTSFADVRIHTGPAASESARALDATAYTTGRDIVFGDGAYSPQTQRGRHVLAHELAHVVQQRSGPVETRDVGGGVGVSEPSDRFERAAETAARKVTAPAFGPAGGVDARPHAPSATTTLALQRTAGNAAVARSVFGDKAAGVTHPSVTTTIQRFVGHEHETLGNVTGANVDLGNGVVLTWGQVVAIAGDEFGSVEDLRAAVATEPGRRRIRAALEHDAVRGPIPATLPGATQADRDAQMRVFIQLAAENVSHFAQGGDALGAWRSHHQRALASAVQAGLTGNQATFQEAQLIEAFGQHFLTDMFSGGHVRTPRLEIMQYYEGRSVQMATAFVERLRARVEAGLVSQVMFQLHMARLAGNFTQRQVQQRVHDAVGTRLNVALLTIGGMPGLARYFGLGIAGAVSGALHDREGRIGVVVHSTDHPQPWLARGDAMLDQSPESRDQAERAVLAAREELVAARFAGAREVELEFIAPADPPAVVFFGFNSNALNGAASAVTAAGAYLHIHPDDHVELVGHTDPLGTEDFNDGLGRRRADAVRDGLIQAGARPSQISTSTQGERQLVTTNWRRFAENRRVQFIWQCVAPPLALTGRPNDARSRAQEAISAFGPPFERVERYVPQPVLIMNEPLPEWRWGQMAPELVAELDTWVRAMVSGHTATLIAAVPDNIQVEGFGVNPRQIVAGIVGELMAAPARTLGDLIGQQPGR